MLKFIKIITLFLMNSENRIIFIEQLFNSK